MRCLRRTLEGFRAGVGGLVGFVSMSVWRTVRNLSAYHSPERELVAGEGFEPADLQVMSLASYLCSIPLETVYQGSAA